MKYEQNKRGSMMVGALIMMLVISAISIAIINRTSQGTNLAIDTRKGYNAYQVSDSATELFLNNLKNLDGDLLKIPENTAYDDGDFCGDVVTCLDEDGDTISSSDSSVADIYKIQTSGSSQDLTRKIEIAVNSRIDSGLESVNFEVKSCGDGADGTCTWNTCDVKISLTPSIEPTITGKIKDYEVRGSDNSSLDNEDANWEIVGDGASDHPLDADNNSFVLKNTESLFGYGETHYFTVKARNKNPFSLDSLYLRKNEDGDLYDITMPLETGDPCPNCGSNSLALTGWECISPDQAPDHSEPVKTLHTCCNGTEYYQCEAGYTPFPLFNKKICKP